MSAPGGSQVRDLARLPKAHLHLHLTGMMRRGTLTELATEHQVAVPAAVDDYPSFAEFVTAYNAAHAVLRTRDDLARLVREMVADAAVDGAVWIEPSLSLPGYRTITGDDAETLALVCDTARQAAQDCGIGVGIVVAADRGRDDPAGAEHAAALAARYVDRGVVGFGLGGDERHPPGPFTDAFAIARAAGLLSVPHAGELAGPDSVGATLEALSPDRIMHGIRAADDPQLVTHLAETGVGLDVCPTSNRALGVVDEQRAHPLPALLAAGVACSINADSSLAFHTSLLGEYQRSRDHLGLTDHELATAARVSLTTSAAPAPVITDALRGIDAWAATTAPAAG